MKLELEGSALEKALHAAVISSLGEVGKRTLMDEVVKYLTTPTKDVRHRYEASPLMQAVFHSTEKAARDVVKEMLDDPKSPLKACIRQLVINGVEDWIKQTSEDGMAEKISSSIMDVLNKGYRGY